MRAPRAESGISITVQELQAALQADEKAARAFVVKLGSLLGQHDKETRIGSRTATEKSKNAERPSISSLDTKAAKKLATEVANECLKQLSRTDRRGCGRDRNDEEERSPLNTVDSNIVSSPKKSSANSKTGPRFNGYGAPSANTRIAAECACIAFRYLTSTSKSPDARICDGLMVLCGRLLSNEHFNLAEGVLKILRQTLEADSINTSGSLSAARCHLLSISVATAADADFLKRVILYQSMVLRLAAAIPQDQGLLLSALQHESCGPDAVITRWIALRGDRSKGASYFETLSTSLLAIAPLGRKPAVQAPGTDGDACVIALRLQTLALQYRRKWWDLADHESDNEAVRRDLSRALRSLTVPSSDRTSATARYMAAQECLKLLQLYPSTSCDNVAFEIVLSMWQLAHAAHDVEASTTWSESLVRITQSMPVNHAKHICARIVWLFQCLGRNDAIPSEDISAQLRSKLCGSGADVLNLIHVVRGLFSEHEQTVRQSAADSILCQLLLASLKVAQRLWRSSADATAPHLLSLLKTALRVPSLRKTLPACIGVESLEILIKCGTLDQVASLTMTSSTNDAWKCCGDAVIMSQVIKLLMIKAAQSEQPDFHDTDLLRSLQPLERAVLVQARLERLMEIAATGRHINTVGQLISAASDELRTILAAEKYPLRRKTLDNWHLIAQDALGLQKIVLEHESHSSPEALDLAEDRDLTRYQHDVNACSHLAQFLQAPAHRDLLLERAIKEWSMLLDDSTAMIYHPDMSIRLVEMAIAYHDAILYTDTSTPLLILKLRLQRRQHGTRWPVETLAHLLESLPSSSDQFCVQSIVNKLRIDPKDECHSELAKLQAYVALASWHIKKSEFNACRALLEQAAIIGESLSALPAPRHDRLCLLETCTKLWKVRSILSLHDDNMTESLIAAKNCLIAANSIWRLSGRASKTQHETDEVDEESREERGAVSKLQLADQTSSTAAAQQSGALYWKGVRASCEALLHIADIYAHFGDFVDADAYSRQALKVAMPLEQSNLLISVRSHRAALLSRAGKQEEAAMMLAKNDVSSPDERFEEAVVKHFIASAVLALNEIDHDGALEAIREAKHCQERLELRSRKCLLHLDSVITLDSSRSTAKSKKQSADSKTKSRKPLANAQPVQRPEPIPYDTLCNFGILSGGNHTIAMLEQRIALEMDPSHVSGPCRLSQTAGLTSSARNLQFDYAMSKLDDQLKQDLRLNALREMVIVQPTLFGETSPLRTKDRRRAQKPMTKQKSRPDHKLSNILEAAQSALQPDSSTVGLTSVAEIYDESSRNIELLSYKSILEDSAFVRNASGSEQERASSMAHGRHSIALRSKPKITKSSLPWRTEDVHAEQSVDLVDFRAKYIDILPNDWTATSLHLNEQESKLMIARYRKDEQPFIVSLPFGRTDDELDASVAFDYQSAKAELSNIIDRSNKSCHASTAARKTKSDWWREREDLDRRLEALLRRISEEWLGGFVGLLSAYKTSSVRAVQVRTALESFINRHWGEHTFRISDAIVELFAHVFTSTCDTGDHETAVLDLLCSLNDYLRVKGVDLLDDEADFDDMTVQLAEALHQSTESDVERSGHEHLVLILDKRLQMFPWESLPCLSGASVSRLGSMSMLRAQILALRKQCIVDSNGISSVPRGSGTAIVNPTSDLIQTEAVLQPMLSQMTEHEPSWSVRTRHIPTEEEFSQALSSSSIFMYFGHGSGAQYIRPQTVRRLKSCSEIVWLMGCSSGNVREYGAYEPSSMPYHYLLANGANEEDSSVSSAKCLGVVANLWDVTDKDIDRFSVETGRRWGLWQGNEDSRSVKTTRKIGLTQVPVTPKRPTKAQRIPGPRLNTEPDDLVMPLSSSDEPVALGKAVAQSRDVCFLRYLNGAAPVLYGIPVSLAR